MVQTRLPDQPALEPETAPSSAQTASEMSGLDALTGVEYGRAVFRGTPRRRHYNPHGAVHGGWYATLLDSCMSCAVYSTLPAGMGYTTLEFKIDLLRPITEATGPVEAEGRVVRRGQRVGVAEGRLSDASGRLLARGSATCLIFAH